MSGSNIQDSAIGRENLEELIDKNSKELNSEKILKDCNKSLLSHKIINVDDLKDIEILKDISVENSEEKSGGTIKLSEGMLWHVRLGHASLNYLQMLKKKEKILEHVKFDDSIRECEVCLLSKMEKIPFKQNRSRAERSLQRIHSDLMGPIKPNSWPGQKRYVITFVDDYSRYARTYCLKSKDETGEALEEFIISARNLLGYDGKICYIRSDRGSEYTGGKFSEIMKKENIELDSGPPYTPELNGLAERFNKTIQNKTRAFMCNSGLPASMWELAVAEAVHSYNITPHKSINY